MEALTGKLSPVGLVRSRLTATEDAPKQGREGGVEAQIDIESAFSEALDGVRPGHELWLLTWLHRADRGTVRVHPRDDPRNPRLGVFATRSADRPNPIGLHKVRVVSVSDGGSLRVAPLEAIDGTPVLDIKPVLDDEG